MGRKDGDTYGAQLANTIKRSKMVAMRDVVIITCKLCNIMSTFVYKDENTLQKKQETQQMRVRA